MLSATVIIGIINLTLIILVAINNHINHVKLTTNDLVHLAKDVSEIKTEQTCIKNKVISLSEDLAFVKGKCEVHTSKKSKKILNKI